jgi:prepilin-type N-terminal cleavage/methylation domain-containing protein
MARAVPYPTGMRHSTSPRRGGFTFIEMLIVFVVFASVMAISLPSINDTLRKNRVSKVSNILTADIEQAFAIAARQRLPVRMLVDRTNRKFTVVDRNTPTLVYKTRSFAGKDDFSLDSLWSNRDTIDIMPTGLATDTLRLTLGVVSGRLTHRRAVSVSRGGLVRVNGQ